MKTALEQAIEACKELSEKSNYAKMCVDIMGGLIPTENQQIIDAYRAGWLNRVHDSGMTAFDYFTQTFKND